MNKSFLPCAAVFCTVGVSFLLYGYTSVRTVPRSVSDSDINSKSEALVTSLTPIKDESVTNNSSQFISSRPIAEQIRATNETENTNPILSSDSPLSLQPSLQTSIQPSLWTSTQPSLQISIQPSLQISIQPSLQTSMQPSLQTSIQPSLQTSMQPSLQTSMQPSLQTSIQPSLQTSIQPSLQTSMQPSLQPNLSSRSYIVAVSLWEQLLHATNNFLQLQCWAKTLGPHFSTVEPHLQTNGSVLGFSFGTTEFTNISLSSVYDMNTWYKVWPQSLITPIISKEKFKDEITKFDKKVVLVQFKYKSCRFNWNITTLLKDLEQYERLTVTRKVCINVANPLTATEFNQKVLGSTGDHSIQNTLVIFKEWRGINPGRIYLKLTSCSKLKVIGKIRPNQLVVKDAEIYANKFLGGFGQYISVSARFEKVSQKYWTKKLEQLRQEVKTAISESMTKVHELKRKRSVERVYLSYDFGQFGSHTFESHSHFYNSSDLLIKFQEDLYEGRLNHSAYEQSFMTLKYQNPGYIAVVQMILSSKGKCLLKIGRGSSIEFVTSLFQKGHAQPFCIECAPHNVCK